MITEWASADKMHLLLVFRLPRNGGRKKFNNSKIDRILCTVCLQKINTKIQRNITLQIEHNISKPISFIENLS